MRYRRFASYNVLGGVAWGLIVPMLGYNLGGIPFVRAHIESILMAVVVLSVLPLIVSSLRGQQRRGQMQRIEVCWTENEFAEELTP
jgi:membrane-associated protein